MKRFRVNPFEIFGLTPQVVKELDDETLFKLIKKLYHTLQLHYHPDRGGDPKKALELNLAYDALNLERNPQSFYYYKKSYIAKLSRKTLKTELENLKNTLRKQTYLQEVLKERFWHYLERDGNCHLGHCRAGFVLKLSLLDVIASLNLSDLVGFRKRAETFKEIILGQGIVLKKRAKAQKYQMLKHYKFLGSVKRELLSPWELVERDLREERFHLKDYMTKDTFIREVLYYLSPEIKANSYLFFYNFNDRERVYLEGLLVKVEEITHLEFLELLKKETVDQENRSENVTDNPQIQPLTPSES